MEHIVSRGKFWLGLLGQTERFILFVEIQRVTTKSNYPLIIKFQQFYSGWLKNVLMKIHKRDICPCTNGSHFSSLQFLNV